MSAHRQRRKRRQKARAIELGRHHDHTTVRILSESATAELHKVTIEEVGGGGLTEQGPGRALITLITPGWGTSGFYSEALLKEGGMDKAFPRGTQMFIDHPSRSEEFDRPERSVKELAAVTTAPARWTGKSVQAEAMLFPDHRDAITAKADAIGVSIRAIGESEFGEAEGKTGEIIKSIDEGISVDFVTKAGRGGKIAQILESANVEEARNAGNWLEARIHSMFTRTADELFGEGNLTRDERIALSTAIGEALSAFNASVQEKAPQLYQRDPFADADGATIVNEGGDSRQKEDIMSDEDRQRLSELEESVRKLTTKVEETEAERDKFKLQAERSDEALMSERASRIIEAALEPAEGEEQLLPDRAVKRVRESALGRKLPLTEDGKLDEDRLKERAASALKDELEYLREAVPGGKIEGMGGSGSSTVLVESATATAETTKGLTGAFQRLGLSESAAQRAAEGR